MIDPAPDTGLQMTQSERPLLEKSAYHVPKIMVTNVMSLAPKIDEVHEFIHRSKAGLVFITETWLKSSIQDSVIDISGYTVLRKDRSLDNHGGVCIYLKDDAFKYNRLDELSCCDDHETLWVQLRPPRRPRGFSSLIAAVIYHPFWTKPENDLMRDHLFKSLSLAESKFPNCALIVAGDFNRLDVKSIQRHFRLKQIVKKPTRKNAILDLVLTNLHKFYDTPQSFPPFGLSDHNTVIADARARDTNDSTSIKVVLKRDIRASRKAELGRYLNSIDWSCLFANAENCQDMLNVFLEVIKTGLDCLMPMKTVRVNTSDVPWMTQHLKCLISKRQKAFHTLGAESAQYKFFRNIVNRERKKCKGNFYKTKVAHAKDENPRLWWKEVKRLGGAKSHSGDLKHQIQIEGVEDLSDQDLANMINKALLEPLEEYRLTQPLVKLPIEIDTPELHEI